jgi:phospholipase/carboxylesterase
MTRPLIVLLHGNGARGQDLVPLGEALTTALPHLRFTAPDAPHPHGDTGLREWYSLTGVTPRNRPGRVARARAARDEVIAAELARFGVAQDLGRVAILGFSQGATMAFDAVATGRWPVAALATFACRFATPGPLTPPPGLRAALFHGLADEAVPWTDSDRAWKALSRAGCPADALFLTGVGHEMHPQGMALMARMLAEAFPPDL